MRENWASDQECKKISLVCIYRDVGTNMRTILTVLESFNVAFDIEKG